MFRRVLIDNRGEIVAPQDIEAFPLPAPHRKLADNCSLFDNPASGE